MSSRPLTKESLYLLNFAGLDPNVYNYFSRFRMMISAVSIVTMTFNVFLDCILNWNGVDSIEGLTIFTSIYQICLKSIAMVIFRKPFKRVIHKMEGFWKIDKYGSELKRDIEIIYKIAKTSVKFMILMITMLLPLYLGKSVIGDTRRLPYSAYYPTDLTKSPDYELAFAYQIFFIFPALVVLLGCDSLFLSLIIHIICELKLLKKSLELLTINHEIKGDDRKNLKYIYEFVDHHNLILSCINDLKEIYSVLLLNVYFFNMTCICAGLLGIISSGFPPTLESLAKYGLYAFFFVMQLFFYCYTGNYLITEHASISNVVYNTEWWIKTQPNFRKACLMVIQRANKTEELTAGGMFSLNLDSFRKVIKSALSFFTVVQAMYKV